MYFIVLHLSSPIPDDDEYLTVIVPGVHGVPPLIYLLLYRGQLPLKKLPHYVYITAVQPVMVNGDCVFLKTQTLNINIYKVLKYVVHK